MAADEQTDPEEHQQESTGAERDAGHEKLARSAEREADELEQRSQEVGQQISDTREEWERKQSSDSVPGAVGEPDRGTPESTRSDSRSASAERDGSDSGPAGR